MTDNASPADARIISVASPPRFPTFPKKLETLALGTLAGLMLSTGVVVSHALLSIDAVAPAVAGRPGRRSRAAAAAVDPERMDATPVGTPQADPETAALVDQLLAGAAPGAALRVLIAGEGESASLAIALAAARRLSGRGRAILVDLGPTAGAAAEAAFGPEADGAGPEGLAQLLAGEASFAEAIQRDGASALDVIRTGGGAIAGEGLDEIFRRSPPPMISSWSTPRTGGASGRWPRSTRCTSSSWRRRRRGCPRRSRSPARRWAAAPPT